MGTFNQIYPNVPGTKILNNLFLGILVVGSLFLREDIIQPLLMKEKKGEDLNKSPPLSRKEQPIGGSKGVTIYMYIYIFVYVSIYLCIMYIYICA